MLLEITLSPSLLLKLTFAIAKFVRCRKDHLGGTLSVGVFQVPSTPDRNASTTYRDTNGSHIVMQLGGVYIYIYIYTPYCDATRVVYTSSGEEGGILLQQEYRDRNGRCVAILFKSIGLRGWFESPLRERETITPNMQVWGRLFWDWAEVNKLSVCQET